MSAPPRRRPIPRLTVAAGGLCLLALLGTIIAIGEVLRHPYQPSEIPEDQRGGGDPRDEITCPEPQPREGQTRDTTGYTLRPIQVTSNELYDCPQTYDGQRVVYVGEVVGDLLARDAGVWTQLNDDVYAGDVGPLPAHRDYRGGNAGVGVLLPHELADQVSYVGGPQTRGDLFEVRGVFHRVDASGEVAVIRADTGQMVREGGSNPDPPLTDRRVAALVAMVVAIGVVGTERWVAARR
ncbi:MAG: hypothetical protein KY460_04910 [Actinobacteria bacterium]|nr:hypothetical protein [Actinomycetota bacterium]